MLRGREFRPEKRIWRKKIMADRIVLNTISYHGHGAIENIVPELTARGYKKAFVCSDPDLIKFGVTKKVTPPSPTCRTAWLRSRPQKLIAS